MRPIMLPWGAGAGADCSSHHRLQKPTLPITPFTGINASGSLPGATGSFGLGMNNRGQVAGIRNDNSRDFDGFLYALGSPPPSTRVLLCNDINGWARVMRRADHDQT
jgi:hypothetical protein